MVEGRESIIPLPWHSNVLMHIECRTELVGLIYENERPAFTAAYEDRIDFLSQNLGRETFLHPTWFEVLKNAHGVRSIHMAVFRNLRILYVVDDGKAFLLLAFEERKGHRNTEYSHYINTALKRLDEKEKMQ